MVCTTVKLANGIEAIVCGPRPRKRKCSVCQQRPADSLCDAQIGGGKTCDKPLCSQCTFSPGPETDYCATHRKDLLDPHGDLRSCR